MGQGRWRERGLGGEGNRDGGGRVKRVLMTARDGMAGQTRAAAAPGGGVGGQGV